MNERVPPPPGRGASPSSGSNGNGHDEVLYSSDVRDIGWVKQNVPCQTACPAATNIPGYIWAIMEGDYSRSYEINRNANVLPGVLGRICSRPCESKCRHGQAP